MGTPIATLTESAGMHQNLLDTTTQTVEEWAVPDHMVGLSMCSMLLASKIHPIFTFIFSYR